MGGKPTVEYGDAVYNYANRQWSEARTIFKEPEPAPARSADAPAPDLVDLTGIFEGSQDLVNEAEELANDVFPNDGKPIVQNNKIRTKYGDAPLPLGNILDPNVRAELTVLSDALESVVSQPEIDGEALNKLLEISRDLKLSYE